MKGIEKLASDLEVFLESSGVRHILLSELLYLHSLECRGSIGPDLIKVGLDGDSESNVGVREEGKPKTSSQLGNKTATWQEGLTH